MFKMCRTITKLNANFGRILFRRRFYSTLEIRGANKNGFDPKFVHNNEMEQFEIFDRCTKYLETELKVESIGFNTKLNLCEKVSEVCDLFSENGGKLTVNQLFLMLSRIIQINSLNVYHKNVDLNHEIDFPDFNSLNSSDSGLDYFPSNDYCLLSLNKLRAVNVKRMDIRVIEIFMKLVNKFSDLNREQVLYLNRMCKYLNGYHKKLILSSTEDLLGPNISQMEPIDVVRIGLVVANKSENVEFVKIYIDELFKKIHSLTKNQKMLIFESMANSKKCSTIFLSFFSDYLGNIVAKTGQNSGENECIVEHAQSDSDSNFSETEYIKFLSVYSKNQKCISKQLFKYLLSKCLVVDLSKLNLSNVLDLVWISNKFNNIDLFLPKVIGLLTQRINEIGPESLTMLIWSYSNSNIENVGFHTVLEQAAVDLSQELTPKNLSLCAYCLSLKMTGNRDCKFLNHIQDDVVSNICHFNGLDLAMLAHAYSSALSGSNVLHQCIQESVLNYVEDLPADCISKLLVSYARISGKASLFSSFMTSFLQRMHQFPIHEFIQVMWAYLVMKFYQSSFWSTCLEVVFSNFDTIINDNRCHLIYPVLSLLTQMNVVALTSDITRLMNHTKKYFWAAQKTNKNSEIVSCVIKLIEGVQEVNYDCNIDNFLVDVHFLFNGKDCAILIYNGSNTFNHAPIGDLKLKELYLSNKGWKIIRIHEDIWINSHIDSQVAILTNQINQQL